MIRSCMHESSRFAERLIAGCDGRGSTHRVCIRASLRAAARCRGTRAIGTIPGTRIGVSWPRPSRPADGSRQNVVGRLRTDAVCSQRISVYRLIGVDSCPSAKPPSVVATCYNARPAASRRSPGRNSGRPSSGRRSGGDHGRRSAGPQAAASSAASEAGDLFVHDRRRFARRHVRPEAAAH